MSTISDFPWASVGHYMARLEVSIGLECINHNHVISFPLGRLGPEKVIAQKERALGKIKRNMARLEAFVGKAKPLEGDELVVLRSMYRTFASEAETCKRHIEVAKKIAANLALFSPAAFDCEEEEDDLPF